MRTSKKSPLAPVPSSTPPSVNPWLASGLLVIGVCLAYFPASQGEFLWDDDDYVSRNAVLRTSKGLFDLWFVPGVTPQYYPMTFTTFWLEFRLAGMNPGLYHWTNILLHAANALLLGAVLGRLQVPGRWLAVCLFAFHPVAVESVAWITERKNTLSFFLFLLSLLAYLRFRPLNRDSPARWNWYFLSLLLFLGALFSKTVSCSLPAVLLLLTWWKHGKVTKKDVALLTPMFALGLLLAYVTIAVERGQVGAKGEDWSFSFVDRCLIAGRALWFYASKLVWPTPLIFIYPRWEIDATQIWQYIFPAGVLIVFAVLLWKRCWGTLTACLIFAGTLLPALGFFNIYPMLFSFVADHFQYYSAAVLLSLMAAGGTLVWQRWSPEKVEQGRVVAGLWIAGLAVLTYLQCHTYRNLDALWLDTLAQNPSAWLAHHNLGVRRWEQGMTDEAMAHLQQAHALNPRHFPTDGMIATIWIAQDRLDEAEARMHKVLNQLPADHREDWLLINIGIIHVKRKNYEVAKGFFEKAIAKRSVNSSSWYYLGVCLDELGEPSKSLEALTQAVRLEPTNAVMRQRYESQVAKVQNPTKAPG